MKRSIVIGRPIEKGRRHRGAIAHRPCRKAAGCRLLLVQDFDITVPVIGADAAEGCHDPVLRSFQPLIVNVVFPMQEAVKPAAAFLRRDVARMSLSAEPPFGVSASLR